MFPRTRAFFSSFWASHQAKVALTAFCILVALFDTFWKSLSIIAASALALAIVPWVVGLIEKLSMPGGFELVLAKAGQKLEDTAPQPNAQEIDAFRYLSGTDPNAAIAYLRIQIERRLREIADEVGFVKDLWKPQSMRMLTEELYRREAISSDAAALIRDLSPVMNEAAHGIHLNDNAATFALEYGPRIMSMLRTPNA